METCNAKHVIFQPNDEQWKCPKCSSDADNGFVIYSSQEDADSDCGLIHPNDEIQCDNCGSLWYGTKLSSILAKKNNVVPCPTCKGKGCVPGPKE